MKRRVSFVLVILALFIMAFSFSASAGNTAGGWTINKKAASYLTAEEKAVFKKAVNGLTGVNYKPVISIASQVVSGKNLAFFCRAKTVTKKADFSWKVVIVYVDLKGNAKVTAVNDFNFTGVSTRKDSYVKAPLMGGWQYPALDCESMCLPASSRTSFMKAASSYKDVRLSPLVLLGKQLVAGMNYRYLACGYVPGFESEACLYLVDVYERLDGSASITNVNVIDIPQYLKY